MVFYVHPDEQDIDELQELESSGQIAIPEDGVTTLSRGQTYRLKRWVVVCTGWYINSLQV